MKYFAYLKQKGEGCDYTIGCAQTLISFDANDDDDAKQKLSERIQEEYTGEFELSSVLLLKNKIEFNLKSVYDDLNKLKNDKDSKMQHIKDMEEFERLKKKLNK
jgi:LPS O-antigen subunit length determinant protein (WzzB/FepE family)